MEVVFSPLPAADLVAVSLCHGRSGLPRSVWVVDADVAFALGLLADDMSTTVGGAGEGGRGGHPARREPDLDELVARAEQRLATTRGDDQP